MSVADLCRAYGISRPTAYRWINRYNETGQKDSWIAAAVRIAVPTRRLSRWRTLSSCFVPSIRPGARASSRQGWKCYSQNWCGLQLAHSATSLSRAGLTSPQRKRKRTTPCSEPFSLVTGPNQLWCMDFKGYFATGDGKRCDPFTITDAHSRYLIRCQIVSRMDLSQVRAICEAAMREYGVPARIRTDNGAPFAGTGLTGAVEALARLDEARDRA